MAATYSIPKDFIDGFKNIVEITEQEFDLLNILIKDLQISESFDSLLERSGNGFKSIHGLDFLNIMRALTSIVNIFEDANRDIEEFTNKFSKSYLLSNPAAIDEDGAILKNRLSILLKNFKNLTITVKSQDLLTDNKYNFKRCRILSDIRMLFDDVVESEEKHAVIVHSLKIEFSENGESKDFFVALDLSDLKKMKIAIERAIEKDSIIKAKQHKINFIDI